MNSYNSFSNQVIFLVILNTILLNAHIVCVRTSYEKDCKVHHNKYGEVYVVYELNNISSAIYFSLERPISTAMPPFHSGRFLGKLPSLSLHRPCQHRILLFPYSQRHYLRLCRDTVTTSLSLPGDCSVRPL